MPNPCFVQGQQVDLLLSLAIASAESARQAETEATLVAIFFPPLLPSRVEAANSFRTHTAADLRAADAALATLAGCVNNNGMAACLTGVLEVRNDVSKLETDMRTGRPEMNGFIDALRQVQTRYRNERAGCDLAVQPVELTPVGDADVAVDLQLDGGFGTGGRRRFATPQSEARRPDSTISVLAATPGHGGPRITVRVDTFDVAAWTVSATARLVGDGVAGHAPFAFAWDWDGRATTHGVTSTPTTSSISFVTDSLARARRLRVTATASGVALERGVLVATPLTRTESHQLLGRPLTWP